MNFKLNQQVVLYYDDTKKLTQSSDAKYKLIGKIIAINEAGTIYQIGFKDGPILQYWNGKTIVGPISEIKMTSYIKNDNDYYFKINSDASFINLL